MDVNIHNQENTSPTAEWVPQFCFLPLHRTSSNIPWQTQILYKPSKHKLTI